MRATAIPTWPSCVDVVVSCCWSFFSAWCAPHSKKRQSSCGEITEALLKVQVGLSYFLNTKKMAVDLVRFVVVVVCE